MFNKVDTKLDYAQMDNEVHEFWEKNNVFKEVDKLRASGKPFVFYEGPPGMNGLPHIGHGTTRIYKDTILRYFSMQNRSIIRRAGWDCHGLPVETKAEKNLGLKNKFEIDSVGVKRFVDECKSVINEYEENWRIATKKLGFWLDLDNAYNTSNDDYIESVWWALKQLFMKGDIYEGYRVGPYCARCGTSLSSHEVAQEYKTVKTRTLYVKFKLKSEKNTYFVAWTTTPWTLPSNVALCVNPDVEYSKVEVDDSYYILANNLVGKLFEDSKLIKTYKGKELEKLEYEPVFEIDKKLLEKKAYYVTCADFVTTTDGTGIVHIAPAFGEDDFGVGKTYDLPVLKLVNEKGLFTADVPFFAGKNNFEANEDIIKLLKEQNKVVKVATIEHEYPHCWRCHNPLMYYARNGWFVRMSKYRDALVNNNNKVNWHPESARDGRMGNFLSNVIDWNLSRDRFWGTPLNIWRCDKCGKLHCVGSRQELMELTGAKEIKELHKPYIDQFTFKCDCGGTASRVSQVVDVWFDSGAMPFAQWHYPFENKEIFESQFPADFICEAKDQTRGWFYTLQAIGTSVFGVTPYKSVIMCDHVLDKNGSKMSKSLGNVVSSDELIDKYGADAVRLFFCGNVPPWISSRVDEDGIVECQRKTLSTLWNTYAFFMLYANIDNFEPCKPSEFAKLKFTKMDLWVLSKLNSTLASVENYMKEFNFTDSVRVLSDFVDELSNWYIRRCRERFWVDGIVEDKTVAFNTLYHCLFELVKAFAPFAPFMSEKIYRGLRSSTDRESVHMCDYPKCNKQFVDKTLNEQMEEAIRIVSLGRAGRNQSSIKNRQPLSKLYVYSSNNIKLPADLLNVIADDLNVKSVEFIVNVQDYISFELKPQLKTLGAKYRENLSIIREFLSKCDAYKVVNTLQSGQSVVVDKDKNIVLTQDDVLIFPHSKPDFVAESQAGIIVVLDTNLTPELIDEGFAREFISKVQTMRKASGFEVEDRIKLICQTDERLQKSIKNFYDLICGIVLADSIEFANTQGESVDINGIECVINIKRSGK